MASLSPREAHVKLARSLPPLLLNFFRKHPPAVVAGLSSSDTTSTTTSLPQLPTSSSSISTSTKAVTAGLPPSITNPAASQSQLAAVSQAHKSSNPFLPFRNPLTTAWRPPIYSARRQAMLYRLASQHGVLSLLPEAPKHPELRVRKREESGLRVKGTGAGQKVKGKSWERQLAGKLEERRRAMERMPEMIREWKQRGHGRGWKKWPK